MFSRLSDLIEPAVFRLADGFFARWPQPMPSQAQLAACRLVAHRGEFDNCRVFENTFPAFDAAVQAGLWGIEFDIRWTSDLIPVIHHDAGLIRLYDDPAHIRDMTFAELRARHPRVPSLSEMIIRYGGRCHLMIELKEESYPEPDSQGRKLKQLLAPLTPEKDFHFLSFDPGLFDALNVEPAALFIPIARLNAAALFHRSVAGGYGGISGHYLFTGRRFLACCQREGLKTAIGFANSTHSMLREINRRVDWLFTDHPARMQRALDRLRQKGCDAGRR